MKTINMNSTHANNKIYRKKCMQYEKFIKYMIVFNASQNDRAAMMDEEIQKVLAERQFLLEKLAECNIVVEPTQLTYKGKCEASFYKDCCKERLSKKKSSKKSH